ncbi:MAG: thiamine phosphate synthase [Synergistes sp.]|nr:thiamine phosphate synthase [Synergistes sp.]
MKFTRDDLLLYAVTDRRWLLGRKLCEVVCESIEGGATFVQLREKELDEDTFLREAKEIRAVCKANNVPFVINDNARIAVAADADGVHVGQSDIGAAEARRMIGENKILGVSVQTAEEAICAEKSGADYLGVGAVFATSSKDDACDVPYTVLREICRAVSVPVVAIGGITKENVGLLAGSGICGIAAISAIYAQKNIKDATRELKEAVIRAITL